MFSWSVKQVTERERVTEKREADNPMEWVSRMNNIRGRATEIVNHGIVHSQSKNGGRENLAAFSIFSIFF